TASSSPPPPTAAERRRRGRNDPHDPRPGRKDPPGPAGPPGRPDPLRRPGRSTVRRRRRRSRPGERDGPDDGEAARPDFREVFPARLAGFGPGDGCPPGAPSAGLPKGGSEIPGLSGLELVEIVGVWSRGRPRTTPCVATQRVVS